MYTLQLVEVLISEKCLIFRLSLKPAYHFIHGSEMDPNSCISNFVQFV